jgi:hypothetical protein
MYDNLASKTPSNTSDVKQSALVELTQRFQMANNDQIEIIYQIEDKLHNILNKRVPQDSPKSEPTIGGDFISEADAQVSRINQCNSRLRGILEHLRQII